MTASRWLGCGWARRRRVVVALVGPAALFAAVATGASSEALGAAAPALPSYFDGCAYLTAEDVQAVSGAPATRQTQGAPGPEDAAAAACSYESGSFVVGLTVWTRASADAARLDFGDLAGFTGDFPLDLSAKVAVAGVGDETWYAPQQGGAGHALLVRWGDVRLLLLGGPQGGDDQDRLAALAGAVLRRLDERPPPPDPTPVPGSLAAPAATYQFGNGRALFVSSSTSSLRQLVGTKVTGRTVFFNGDVPDELDLRALSVVDVGGTTTAVLQFAAPLTVRTAYNKTPVEHRTMVVLRPPQGDAVGVMIGPDGAGVTVHDPLGDATVTGHAGVMFSGTWAVLDIPASVGVTPEWTIQAVVRVEAPGGFPNGRTITGWQLTTVPVTVGSLTGASGITLPAIGAAVPRLPAAAAAGSDRNAAFAPVAVAPSMSARTVEVDARDGHRRLAVTFASPPLLTPVDGTETRATVTLALAPTGPLSPGAPVAIVWSLPASGAPPGTASVRGQDGHVLGVVPVTVTGSTARFDLDSLAPLAPSAPTTSTTAPAGRAYGTLGTDTIRFREEVLLGPDGCICPDGQPPADAAFERDLLEIQLAGPAITLTRRSSGATAVGVIDSRTGHFVASSASEYWSGILLTTGGMVGRHAQLVHTAGTTGFVRTLPAADAGGGDFIIPVGRINTQIGQAGGSGPTSPNDPCWKIANQTVYIGQGRMFIYQGGVPRFIAPPTELGYDQNSFRSTWDYQQWLNSHRWPDGACGQATSHVTARPGDTVAAGARTGAPAAPSVRAAVDPPALLTLNDLADSWSLSADVTISDGTTGDVIARQATPSVQLRLLGGVGTRPSSATTAPATTPTTRSPDAVATTSTPPVPTSTSTSTSKRSSNATPLVITVAIVIAGAGGATAILGRRRRRTTN